MDIKINYLGIMFNGDSICVVNDKVLITQRERCCEL